MRLQSLDWLRGAMALSVMLYHSLGRNDDASQLICRLGIYAVAIFFILSGLSMGLVYDRYIVNIRTAVSFFLRRIFRIWPLLWLVIAMVAFQAHAGGRPFSWLFIAGNLTTAFGFLAPSRYMVVGGWSIGNEMVYYALTPLLIPAYRRSVILGHGLTLIAFGIFVLFTCRLLNPQLPLAAQWTVYVNPFDNLFFYCAGLSLYYQFRHVMVPARWKNPVFFTALIAFWAFPVSGGQIALVTGGSRLALSFIAVLIVFAFFKCAPRVPPVIGRALENVGVATYGIYLLHPIVIVGAQALLARLGISSPWALTSLVAPTTIAVSLIMFRQFEARCIRLGKNLTNRWLAAAGA